jgi:nitroimidazol reductase NimA-like FMN-containing flavoprotein (pyridoxamine 5'-phosphate oxidase superfamily)
MPKLDIAMADEEREAYLVEQRTVRLATAASDGTPHVVPLWFVWHEGAMWLNSTLGNVTVENMLRSGRATGVVDDGETYDRLRGVSVGGRVERIGDTAPEDVERTWSEKYLGGNELPYRRWRDRSWFRLIPERVASWDFRKIPEARAAQRRKEGPR